MAVQSPWKCMLSPLSSLSPYLKLHSPKVTLIKLEFSASLLRTSPIAALVVLTAFPSLLKPSDVWQKILLLPSKRLADPFASALALTENVTPPVTSLDESVWPCGEAMPLCLSITLQPSLPPLMAWHKRIHSHKKTMLCLVLFSVCIFIVFIILSEGAQAKKKIL